MRDDGKLKVFGFTHPDLEEIPIPIGKHCEHCDEPIEGGEPGFSMIHIDEHKLRRIYEHRECFLRGIFGSVAHIERRCSCFVPGSTCLDPEGMTPRQAAKAALEAYERNNGRMVR